VGATFIFCLPGSPGACRDGWVGILGPQLDYRTKPCNIAILDFEACRVGHETRRQAAHLSL